MTNYSRSLKYYKKNHDGDWVTQFINNITKLYINYNDITNKFDIKKIKYYNDINIPYVIAHFLTCSYLIKIEQKKSNDTTIVYTSPINIIIENDKVDLQCITDIHTILNHYVFKDCKSIDDLEILINKLIE